jgi:hypothetical protein
MSSLKRTWPAVAALLAALVLATAAVAAYGPDGAVYGGKITTNQGKQAVHPFSLSLTANGKRVKALTLYWHTKTCTVAATDYAGALTAKNTAIQRNGRFSAAFTFSEPNPDNQSQRLSHRVEYQGKVGPRRAAGTYRDVITIVEPTGNAVGTCDTGTVNWSGSRGRRHYGGETLGSQFLPVSITRRGSKISSFFIQWKADCGGGTFLERAVNHRGIAVNRRGRFSKSGSLSFTTDKGANVTGTFSLSGRFNGRKVSGRYTVNATGTSTTGQKFNCSISGLRYGARRG